MVDTTSARRQFADVRFLLVQVRASLSDPSSARYHLEEAIRRLDGLARLMGDPTGGADRSSAHEAHESQD